jgi:hypothetical protein
VPLEHLFVHVAVKLSALNGEQFVLHTNEGSRNELTGHNYTHVRVDGSAYLLNVQDGEQRRVFGSA